MNANAMAYTLGEAANAVGKAKSTIFKACKDGLLSFTRHDRGRIFIQPVELHSVFPPVSAERSVDQPADQPRMDARTDPETLKAVIERDFLKREIEQLRTLLDDMKSERDEWRRQAQTLALTDQSKPQSPRRPWWRRLAARG